MYLYFYTLKMVNCSVNVKKKPKERHCNLCKRFLPISGRLGFKNRKLLGFLCDIYCLNKPPKLHIFKPELFSCCQHITCSCFIQVWKEVLMGICSVLLFQVDLLWQILSTSHPTTVFYVSYIKWNFQVTFQNCHCGPCTSCKLLQDSLDAN